MFDSHAQRCRVSQYRGPEYPQPYLVRGERRLSYPHHPRPFSRDSSLETRCADCSLLTFNVSGTTVGTALATRLVGYVRSHPKINYVMFPYDPAASGTVPQIAANYERARQIARLTRRSNAISVQRPRYCNGAGVPSGA